MNYRAALQSAISIIFPLLLAACPASKPGKEINEKRPYLAVYDYGMGGVWLLIDARSIKEIESKYPKLKAYEDKPEWMSKKEKAEYIQDIESIGCRWDIDENPTGWLSEL